MRDIFVGLVVCGRLLLVLFLFVRCLAVGLMTRWFENKRPFCAGDQIARNLIYGADWAIIFLNLSSFVAKFSSDVCYK